MKRRIRNDNFWSYMQFRKINFFGRENVGQTKTISRLLSFLGRENSKKLRVKKERKEDVEKRIETKTVS